MPIEYIYCDANVFLAYFNGEFGRVGVLEDLFDEVQKDDEKLLITSTLSVVEVSHIATEKVGKRWQLLNEMENAFDVFWANDRLVRLVESHEILARSARGIIRKAIEAQGTIKPYDAMHLATAKSVNVHEFFTYDLKDLAKFAGMMGFSIVNPYVSQPRLLRDDEN